MRTEKEIMKQIENRLKVWSMTGEVEFYMRINSGSITTKWGSHMKLASKGTPDWLVLVRNKYEGLTCLFIEAKSDVGRPTSDQIKFSETYNEKAGFAVLLLREIGHLDWWMEKNAKNFVDEIGK